MAITVSLVIPSFNRGSLISETLDSALSQTVPFHEIIVVDDGSTDNTQEVLASYGDRINVISCPRNGVQAARNAGAAIATGDYITLCDSDDLLTPQFLASFVECLRIHPDCEGYYSNFVTFVGETTQPDKFSLAPPGYFDGARSDGDFLSEIPDLYVRTVAYQPLFMSGCIVSRKLYEALGGFDTKFNNVGGEDWEFTLRVISAGKVVVCKQPTVRIRKHALNQSGDPIRQVRGTAQILEYALEHHPVAARYRDAIVRSIEERRLSVFHVAFGRGNFPVAQEMLQLLRKHPGDMKFRIKHLITRLPARLRDLCWSMSQRGPAR